MTRGLWLPTATWIDPAGMAREAERRGYASLWVGELWGGDAFVRLTRAAAATSRIGLGTAIVNTYSRTPATIAMAAASLQRAADGRFTLGLGPGSRQGVEAIHGLAFDRPATRLEEVATAIRRLTAGGDDPVSMDGAVIGVSDVPPIDVELPLLGAALGPATRRVTGRCLDGWLPHLIPLDDLGSALVPVRDAARDAGRDPDEITVLPYVPTAVHDDPSEARRTVASHVAYYVGSAGGYRRAVSDRFPGETDRIASAWRDGDREAARAAVTDGMIDSLGVAGSPDEARDRFASLEERDVVDGAIAVTAGRPDRDRLDRVSAALAPQSGR